MQTFVNTYQLYSYITTVESQIPCALKRSTLANQLSGARHAVWTTSPWISAYSLSPADEKKSSRPFFAIVLIRWRPKSPLLPQVLKVIALSPCRNPPRVQNASIISRPNNYLPYQDAHALSPPLPSANQEITNQSNSSRNPSHSPAAMFSASQSPFLP